MTPVVSISNLHKTYRLGRVDVPVLRGVSVDVERGEWLAVLGASGSGKSTLLHLVGGLDRPDLAGNGTGASILFEGRDINRLPSAELDRYRARAVGFVFQFYHLLPELSVLDNVLIAAMVRHGRFGYRRAAGEARTLARELLDRFGLGHRLRHRPAELSGGERQRVAIARALVNRPTLLLADEPTGNLDLETGRKILDVFAELRTALGLTVIVVTHDPNTAERADRVVRLVDGRLAGENGDGLVAVAGRGFRT